MAKLVHLADYRRQGHRICFDRRELTKILALYAERVARGEWRDYAIDHRPNMAAFAVFRSSLDWPLYVIAKFGPEMRRQGNYVVSSGSRKLTQGRSIDDVLRVFAREAEPA